MLRAPGLPIPWASSQQEADPCVPAQGQGLVSASESRWRDRAPALPPTGRVASGPHSGLPGSSAGKEAGGAPGSASPSGPTSTSHSPHLTRLLSICSAPGAGGRAHTPPRNPQPQGPAETRAGLGRRDTGSPGGRWRGGGVTPTGSSRPLLSHTLHPPHATVLSLSLSLAPGVLVEKFLFLFWYLRWHRSGFLLILYIPFYMLIIKTTSSKAPRASPDLGWEVYGTERAKNPCARLGGSLEPGGARHPARHPAASHHGQRAASGTKSILRAAAHAQMWARRQTLTRWYGCEHTQKSRRCYCLLSRFLPSALFLQTENGVT